MRPATLALLLALPTLGAAPAPRPRPAGVRPGLYSLVWQGFAYDMQLTQEGVYRCRPEGRRNWAWAGSYQWCPDTRTLYVQERHEGGAWAFWSARLDGSLEGSAQYGGGKVKVRMRAVRAAPARREVGGSEQTLSWQVYKRSRGGHDRMATEVTDATDATRVERVALRDLPDGVYDGVWGGYEVDVTIGGISYRLASKDGIRTPAAPCRVTVAAGKVSVEVVRGR